MKFQYLDAPEAEILDLVKGVKPCGICGAENRCFSLNRAFLAAGTPKAELGCVECLRAGRFGFSHDTEVGFLDQHQLHWELEEEPMTPVRVFVGGSDGAVSETAHAPRTRISQHRAGGKDPLVARLDFCHGLLASLEGLRRTPRFSTWNEVPWHVHCSDFMVYLGTWEPGDFQAFAAKHDSSGKAVFKEMIDFDYHDMWVEGAEEFGFACHVFRCSACGKHVGFPDFD